MNGVNKAILMGHIGREPEVRYLESGDVKTSFSLATNRSYINKNKERVTQTEWHNIVLWKNLAKVAEKYLKKGDAVYIEGEIHTRSYQDKTGNTKYITEIVGNVMQMISNKNNTSTAEETSRSMSTTTNESSAEDELPF